MRKAILECVPNFSEGKDPEIINAIAEAVKAESRASLLNVDSNRDADRTVYTIAGSPDSVFNAAYNAIAKAVELIDLRGRKGKHPRMGAADVCPLIPLRNISMEETVILARELGQKVGNELDIPVYLYEYAAQREDRRALPDIRKGEFEKLDQKITQPEWQPDYGPSRMHPSAGAAVIGARQFLIAYNINLTTKDADLAHEIAREVRESGRKEERNGEKVTIRGRLSKVRAIGWYLRDFDCAQVSLNLLNFWKTNMAEVFETVREVAREKGTEVNGSELVGMIPMEAIEEAVKYYDEANANLSEEEMVDLLNRKLGLDQVKPFDPEEKVIEWKLRSQAPDIVD